MIGVKSYRIKEKKGASRGGGRKVEYEPSHIALPAS